MKKLISFLVLLGALASSAHASVGQVTNLSNAGSSVICIPGSDDQVICVQNNGTVNARLSIDGGAAFFVQSGGKPGTNPTPTRGFLLPAGQQCWITTVPYTAGSLPNLHKPIVAILTGAGTTTLDIVTDGVQTQYPTT